MSLTNDDLEINPIRFSNSEFTALKKLGDNIHNVMSVCPKGEERRRMESCNINRNS